MSKKELKAKIFDNVKIFYNVHLLDYFDDNENDAALSKNNIDHKDKLKTYELFEYIMIKQTKKEYAELYLEIDSSQFKHNAKKTERYHELKSQQIFKKKILMFWTGVYGILTQEYKINIHSEIIEPGSHTCFNELDLPLTGMRNVKDLFNSFMGILLDGVDEKFTIM